MRSNRLSHLALVAFLAAVGCGGGGGGGSGEQHSDAAIDAHVLGLSYDPAALLGVQSITGAKEREDGEPVNLPDEAVGSNLLVCSQVEHDLKTNVEEVAILRPTGGVVWPGALVKANAGLLAGLPEPLTLAPAPITLRVDLPGMGERGTFVVTNPSNSSVQAKLDETLAWWHDHNPGYVNPASQSLAISTSFTSEQLALDLGLNVRWATGSVATQMSKTTSTESTVTMMVYQQVFYTVTLDTPARPNAMFADTVLPSEAVAGMTSASPPAYVHSVSYGRIIMFRMETSEAVSAVDAEAAMKYAGGVQVSGELEAHYKSVLEKSSITLITIGGNAEVATRGVTARSLGDLLPIIQENAIYTRDNPGVPIAYTVKFLKDNTVAKMGYTTSYTSTECQLMKPAAIAVKNDGWFTARSYLQYTPRGGTGLQVGSGKLGGWGLGAFTYDLAAGATNVTLITQVCTIPWPLETWSEIARVHWDIPPEYVRYCLKGTTGSPKMEECTPTP